MNVYIDTNIIFKEKFFRSTIALAFLKASRLLGIHVLIPEIVIDEVKGNYFSELSDKYEKYKKAHNKISNLLDIEIKKISPDEKAGEYNIWLDNILNKYDVEILPYPEILLKAVVEESYKKIKPFKESGDGHKDFIIWKTINSHIRNQTNPFDNYFLTENTIDFCEKKDNEFFLHPTLSGQIHEIGAVPKIFCNLKKFFDQKVGPTLHRIYPSEIPELSREKIESKTQEILEEDLNLYSADGFEGLGFGNDVTVIGVHEVKYKNIDYKGIGEDEIIINISGNVLIEVDGFIDKHDYYGAVDEEDKNIHILDSDWNKWVMHVSSSISTPFEVTLSYSKDSKEIASHALSLPNEIHELDY